MSKKSHSACTHSMKVSRSDKLLYKLEPKYQPVQFSVQNLNIWPKYKIHTRKRNRTQLLCRIRWDIQKVKIIQDNLFLIPGSQRKLQWPIFLTLGPLLVSKSSIWRLKCIEINGEPLSEQIQRWCLWKLTLSLWFHYREHIFHNTLTCKLFAELVFQDSIKASLMMYVYLSW